MVRSPRGRQSGGRQEGASAHEFHAEKTYCGKNLSFIKCTKAIPINQNLCKRMHFLP